MEFDQKLAREQGKVDAIRAVMLENAEKAALRGESLQDIELKSDVLLKSSKQFQDGTRKLKWKMCRQHWRVIIAFVVVIAVILVMAITSVKNNQ
jgi:type IV secretory pathway component VirB8